jgi:outer membrane protein
MAKERDDKIANIKSMEREISDFRQTRERQLQEQLMRMREGIVKEITDVVMEKVKAKSLEFVLDKSGISINGVPVVLYSPDNIDFTNEIIDTLNKPGRATASTKKAAGPSVTPAAARATKP